MGEALTKEEYLALSEEERMRARLIGLRRHLEASEQTAGVRRRGVPDRDAANNFDADKLLREQWFEQAILRSKWFEDVCDVALDAVLEAVLDEARAIAINEKALPASRRAGIRSEAVRRTARKLAERAAG